MDLSRRWYSESGSRQSELSYKSLTFPRIFGYSCFGSILASYCSSFKKSQRLVRGIRIDLFLTRLPMVQDLELVSLLNGYALLSLEDIFDRLPPPRLPSRNGQSSQQNLSDAVSLLIPPSPLGSEALLPSTWQTWSLASHLLLPKGLLVSDQGRETPARRL